MSFITPSDVLVSILDRVGPDGIEWAAFLIVESGLPQHSLRQPLAPSNDFALVGSVRVSR